MILFLSIAIVCFTAQKHLNQHYVRVSVGTVQQHHWELISRVREDAINKQMPAAIDKYKKRFNLK